jgi:tubulin polyglutamylase TTLL6/13
MSQGKGIFITNDIDSIGLDEPTVVQEYLNSPYLIDGLKFDMRIYVLVMSCDPLKIFVHREGLVRFAT